MSGEPEESKGDRSPEASQAAAIRNDFAALAALFNEAIDAADDPHIRDSLVKCRDAVVRGLELASKLIPEN